MATFPSFPLWIDRYMADTEHLSLEEHGAYLRILMAMWIAPQQRLPNDDKFLGRRFRCTPDQVQNLLRPLIREFCQTDGNWITQQGLSREWAKVAKMVKQRSAAAKSRWNKEKASSERITESQSKCNGPTPIPTPIKKEEDNTTQKVYAFEAGVIRLTEKDFQLWEKSFPQLDLRAELVGLAEWAAGQTKWFPAVSGALAKRNRDIRLRLEQSRNGQERHSLADPLAGIL